MPIVEGMGPRASRGRFVIVQNLPVRGLRHGSADMAPAMQRIWMSLVFLSHSVLRLCLCWLLSSGRLGSHC